MKNFIICWLIFLAIMLVNCQKADNNSDCGCNGKTYQVLNNAEGIVDSLGEGMLRIYLQGPPQREFMPCNLSDSITKMYLKDSLKVIFSGEIKTICPNWGLAGEPIIISKIEMVSDSI
jgi:hypothetical protein